MDRYVFLISFFVVAAIGTARTFKMPEEVYWHTVLPNAPMPSALMDVLHPDRAAGIITNMNAADKAKNYDQYAANAVVSGGVYGQHIAGKMPQNVDLGLLFFLEKDLQPGTTKNMSFQRINVLRSAFVPREVAEAIPFSVARLPEILHHFSVKQDSAEAGAMKTTLEFCEMPEFDGEHKFCSTSLESLVESSMLELGTRNVQAMSTTMSNEKMPKQTYTVASSGLQRLLPADGSSKAVLCHPTIYPSAVYYCHSVEGTKMYKVALTGKGDGSKVEALAVCHTKTAKFDPEHVAFKVLKVKPGTVPICHILPQDALLWIPANK